MPGPATVEQVRSTAGPTLKVSAPSRLHFGLMNESGLLGRIDGGVGAAIASPAWQYTLRPARAWTVAGCSSAELRRDCRAMCKRLSAGLGIPPMAVEISRSVPPHAGFGSKTSLLGSLALALYRIADGSPERDDIIAAARRGGTSGVGIHTVQTGGCVVDLGRSYPAGKSVFVPSSLAQAAAPSLLAGFPAPDLKVVHFRFAETGPSGQAELDVFRQACPVPGSETSAMIVNFVCRVLPGLVEQDEVALNTGIAAIQHLGLKRAEWEAQSAETKAFRAFLARKHPEVGLGLSSMGPTMFAILSAPDRVLQAVDSFGMTPIHCEVSDFAQDGTVIEYVR
jgi:beta-ribofuranosylaminobenzene 5'-phosphate synthase